MKEELDQLLIRLGSDYGRRYSRMRSSSNPDSVRMKSALADCVDQEIARAFYEVQGGPFSEDDMHNYAAAWKAVPNIDNLSIAISDRLGITNTESRSRILKLAADMVLVPYLWEDADVKDRLCYGLSGPAADYVGFVLVEEPAEE